MYSKGIKVGKSHLNISTVLRDIIAAKRVKS
jgi:hypothetical protein